MEWPFFIIFGLGMLIASVLVISVWAWLGPRLRATAPSLESVEPKGGA